MKLRRIIIPGIFVLLIAAYFTRCYVPPAKYSTEEYKAFVSESIEENEKIFPELLDVILDKYAGYEYISYSVISRKNKKFPHYTISADVIGEENMEKLKTVLENSRGRDIYFYTKKKYVEISMGVEEGGRHLYTLFYFVDPETFDANRDEQISGNWYFRHDERFYY